MPQAATASEYDVVVIGAGAGGMTAAAVAATRGLRSIVIEKTPLVGGTTAISGGMVWAPNTTKRSLVGADDTPAQAATYLETVVGTPEGADLRAHYLAEAPKAIEYLESHTSVRLTPVPFYPDYYPDVPGATLRGRVLEPVPFDARELGDWFPKLRPPLPEFTLFGGMMVARADIVHFRNVFKSARSALRVARLVAGYGADRMRFHRGTSLVLGNALAGRLLKSLLDLDVPILLGTAVTGLRRDGRAVVGIEVRTASGEAMSIGARLGVVLASGGFSHSDRLRRELLPVEAGDASAAADGNTGDGLDLGKSAGGFVVSSNRNNAFWTPVSRLVRANGESGVYPHTVTDRGKPGMLAVDKAGRRFTNEADELPRVRAGHVPRQQAGCGHSGLSDLRRQGALEVRAGCGATNDMAARELPALRLPARGANAARAGGRARHRCGQSRGDGCDLQSRRGERASTQPSAAAATPTTSTSATPRTCPIPACIRW